MKGRVLLWALLMGGSAQLSAQVDRASLVGTVTDSSGAVIPAARVEVLSQETGLRREAETGPNGVYTVSQLPIGVFDINILRPGFRTVTVKELRLGVGDNRTLNVTMEPSTVDTQITIQSEIVPIETTSPVIGTVIGSQQMREIPLNGRHWASLMALAPGAINTGDGSQQTIRFVGRARDDNNWTFDGLDATGVKDPRQEAALRLVISTDTIAEFRVNSTLYSAESGRWRRRSGEPRVEVRHEPVSRQPVRVLPQRQDGCAKSVRHVEAAVPPEPVRRQHRRPDHAQPDLLLRELRGTAAARLADAHQ